MCVCANEMNTIIAMYTYVVYCVFKMIMNRCVYNALVPIKQLSDYYHQLNAMWHYSENE